MMTAIVTARAAFRLTASEAKTEIMCLQKKGGGHVPFTVTAASQVYNKTVELYTWAWLSAQIETFLSVEESCLTQRPCGC